MVVTVKETDLPQELTQAEAVEAAYTAEIAEVVSKLQRKLPVLIECDKDLVQFLYANIRDRLRQLKLQCTYLDGRPDPRQPPNPMQGGIVSTMIQQLTSAVRGAVEQRVVVLPHLDLLTTTQGGLTGEAREVIPLMYENPELVWLGFKDPSFPLPTVIENLFPHRVSLLGISRTRLRHLITRKESRKFGREFNPWALYKYVSGVNAAKLRTLLSTLVGEDYPASPERAYHQLRQATLGGTLEIPNISLENDIGGYKKTKEQLSNEILEPLRKKEALTSEEEIKAMEHLIPKGLLLCGPPGTGKTLFAKAMASAIGAAVQIVSGPELKSKWVGESEENLRRIFLKARQSAPAVIVFDEIDSFASARGTYTGSGVEHSMVNQLLTEMDGFHKEEAVFIIGTTNFVSSLDPALLRPGRFEFHLEIPYPDADARRDIIKIYNKKMNLKMSEEAIEFAVKRTGSGYSTQRGTPFCGDDINAMARALSRLRMRKERKDNSVADDVETALSEYEEKFNDLTPKEELLLATHECGHAVTSLFTDSSRTIECITIKSESTWAPAYVRYAEDSKENHRRLGLTQSQMFADLCTLYGGREAERLLIGDISTGAAGSDLLFATHLVNYMVEFCGMRAKGGKEDPRQYRHPKTGDRYPGISLEKLKELDDEIYAMTEQARQNTIKVLTENKDVLIMLRDMLLEKKTIESKTLKELLAGVKKDESAPAANGEKSKKKSQKVRTDV